MLFHELFNGRSGYRAQYYLAVKSGEKYNRAMVDGLSLAIEELHGRLSGCDGPSKPLAQSLGGGSSKIWMPNDEQLLKAAPIALRPPRWREFWRSRELAWGLRVPFPSFPQIDLVAPLKAGASPRRASNSARQGRWMINRD